MRDPKLLSTLQGGVRVSSVSRGRAATTNREIDKVDRSCLKVMHDRLLLLLRLGGHIRDRLTIPTEAVPLLMNLQLLQLCCVGPVNARVPDISAVIAIVHFRERDCNMDRSRRWDLWGLCIPYSHSLGLGTVGRPDVLVGFLVELLLLV